MTGAKGSLFSTPGPETDPSKPGAFQYKGGMYINEEFPGNDVLFVVVWGWDKGTGNPGYIDMLLSGVGISAGAPAGNML